MSSKNEQTGKRETPSPAEVTDKELTLARVDELLRRMLQITRGSIDTSEVMKMLKDEATRQVQTKSEDEYYQKLLKMPFVQRFQKLFEDGFELVTGEIPEHAEDDSEELKLLRKIKVFKEKNTTWGMVDKSQASQAMNITIGSKQITILEAKVKESKTRIVIMGEEMGALGFNMKGKKSRYIILGPYSFQREWAGVWFMGLLKTAMKEKPAENNTKKKKNKCTRCK